jgi:hypothetical protein
MKNMIDIVSTSITKNWNEVLMFFLLSWLFCFGFSCVLILEKPKLYMQHRSKEKVILHIAYQSFGVCFLFLFVAYAVAFAFLVCCFSLGCCLPLFILDHSVLLPLCSS